MGLMRMYLLTPRFPPQYTNGSYHDLLSSALISQLRHWIVFFQNGYWWQTECHK